MFWMMFIQNQYACNHCGETLQRFTNQLGTETWWCPHCDVGHPTCELCFIGYGTE